MTVVEILEIPKNGQAFEQLTDCVLKENKIRRLIIVAIRDFLFAGSSPYCCYDCAGWFCGENPLIRQYTANGHTMPREFYNVEGFLSMLSEGKLPECKKFKLFKLGGMEALNMMKIEYHYKGVSKSTPYRA